MPDPLSPNEVPPNEATLEPSAANSAAMPEAPADKRDRILVVEADAAARQNLVALLESAGYETVAAEPTFEGLRQTRETSASPSLLLIGDGASGFNLREVVAEWKASALTSGVPVVLLVGQNQNRAEALDNGADDVLSRPFTSEELLARVRVQLRVKRAMDELRTRLVAAERGRDIARSAVEALASGEKFRKDAKAIGRALTRGAILIFIGAGLMATFFFLFNHTARKQQRLTSAYLGQVGQVGRQRGLMAEVRRLRSAFSPSSTTTVVPSSPSAPSSLLSPGLTAVAGGTQAQHEVLQKHAQDLKTQMANADAQELRDLQKELAETNARLKKVESSRTAAEGIIGSDVPSVCLLHVAVAFRDKESGRRVHYAGLNQQGEPIQDSEGNPLFSFDERGPELRMDVFGTGFIAGPDGTVLTNRHVAEPWWKDEEIGSLSEHGLQPEISSIRAYFPNDPHAFHAEIDKISSETDLATMRVNLQGVTLPALLVDGRADSTRSGESIVLMGYATGLAGILARADEDTAEQIVSKNNGDVGPILEELAKRGLIRPLITQGHVGDVLEDKIVFDAQTTSGGSGGPLLDHDGKVIGVTYAVLRGFGGSNFGLPARFAASLLGQ